MCVFADETFEEKALQIAMSNTIFTPGHISLSLQQCKEIEK